MSGIDDVAVRVVRENGQYVLIRNGEPYRARGAGIHFGNMQKLAACGANSFRTWTTRRGQQVLDEADRLGLSVLMGIEIIAERHGFDYDDDRAVEAQLERARTEVEKYKDHPALLAWLIGNEPNLAFSNPRVFDAINDVSAMIHAVDGNHPTSTALAGFDAQLAGLIESRAPDLDFVSIQVYGDIVNLPQRLAEIGYDRPYMITEWGAVGHWEVSRTAWDAPIEQTSSEKADTYLARHERIIAADSARIIGSYVFLWGQKQERTPTWYGMFLADGAETEAIDVMHYVWNGRWPEHRAPRIESVSLNAMTAPQNITLQSGEEHAASIVVAAANDAPLAYRWELMHESGATTTGGDREEVPELLAGLIADNGAGSALISVPNEPGPYRLFVYVYDSRGHAAHANIPFYVRAADDLGRASHAYATTEK